MPSHLRLNPPKKFSWGAQYHLCVWGLCGLGRAKGRGSPRTGSWCVGLRTKLGPNQLPKEWGLSASEPAKWDRILR